jgi:hypothetical protein
MNGLKPQVSLYLGLSLLVLVGGIAWAGDIWTTKLCISGWGRQAEGTITEKRIIRGKSVAYRIDYTFPYPSGTAAAETVSSTESVSRSTFDRVVKGGLVPVAYCPWSKARHFVDPEKQNANILMALLLGFMFAGALGYSAWRAAQQRQSEEQSAEIANRGWADPLANHVPRHYK